MYNSRIEIKHLSTGFQLKRGEPRFLHKQLELQLNTGELVCILGPNGAGKSTLLKTILGFEKPLNGNITCYGKPINAISVKEMAKLVSVVLTDKIDDIYLTSREIISMGRYPYGNFLANLTDEDIAKIRDAEKQVEVQNLSGKEFAKLSDGEKQKVMIARSIAQDTPFIFLDEPVAFIDAPSRITIMQLLHQLVQESGKGILMATHDLDSALNYANRIWLLGTNGEWDEGHPEKLLKSGKINRFFDRKYISFDVENKRFNWTGK